MHSTHAHPYSRWLAILFATFSTPALAQQYPPLWTPPYVPNTTERHAKACDDQKFTIEVPLWAPPLLAGFESRFASALTLEPEWFGCASCPRSLYRAKLTAVLPDYSDVSAMPSVPYSRRDGHRRGFVVRFQTKQTGSWAPAPLKPDSACDTVKALRAAAAKAQYVAVPSAPSPQPPILVSRSCDVLGQDAEAWAPPSMLGWANARIQTLPSAGQSWVDVALVDTGVPKSLRSALNVVDERELPTFEEESLEYHPHATHMAALLSAAAPNARIRSYRALNKDGMGSISAVARATDDALFDNGWTVGGRQPLVVNLSVGAPPEFFRPSKLAAGKCQTWEDGSGETLRYVMYVASQLEGQWPTTFVAAANGNVPLEFTTPQLTNDWSLPAPMTPCGVTTVANKSSFFPAAFGAHPSCLSSGTTWLSVLPIGASTFDDAHSVVTSRQAAPKLFAPGERVYAVNAGVPAASTALRCEPSDLGLARGFELPTAVTGTSASTALVSAAATHLIARRNAGPTSAWWNSRQFARLLFLTGQPLCDEDGARTGARRISVARAVGAMTAPGCAALHTCVSTYVNGPAIDNDIGTRCAAAMSACFGSSVPACTPHAWEPGWGSDLIAALDETPTTCSAAWRGPMGPVTSRPDARYVDLHLGGLGPQPSTTSCATCSLVLPFGDASMRLRFELSDTFPPATVISNATVGFLNRLKEPVAWVPVSNGELWRPGQVGELRIGEYGRDDYEYLRMLSDLREMVSIGKLTPVLDLAIQSGRGRPARSVSPLRVETD